MILAAQFNDPERLVGILAILVLSIYGTVKLIRSWSSGPVHPDPWSDEVAAGIAGDDGVPLCHRCLTPQEALADFCPNCCAPVGTYTNLLPFPYLFSIGHTLRIGTEGNFKRSPLILAGYFLLGLAEYSLFAPVYWYVFLKNLLRQSRPGPASEPRSDDSRSEDPSAPPA